MPKKANSGIEQFESVKSQILADFLKADEITRDKLLAQLEQIQRIQLAELSIAKGKRLAE